MSGCRYGMRYRCAWDWCRGNYLHEGPVDSAVWVRAVGIVHNPVRRIAARSSFQLVISANRWAFWGRAVHLNLEGSVIYDQFGHVVKYDRNLDEFRAMSGWSPAVEGEVERQGGINVYIHMCVGLCFYAYVVR